MNRENRTKGWLLVGAGLFLAGILCFLSFELIGSTVDAEGILREPFALIPMGWLAVLSGLVCLGITAAGKLVGHRKTACSHE